MIQFIFLFFANLVAQTNQVSNNITRSSDCTDSISGNFQDEVVYTPFGATLRSHVHYVDSKHYLNNKENHIQVIQTRSGRIVQEFVTVHPNRGDNYSKKNSQFLRSALPVSDYTDGWITYAYCNVFANSSNPTTYFSTDWKVPSPPLKQSDQIVYLFNGFVGIESGVSFIVQPVLQ